MTSHASPPRLIDDPEFAHAIKASVSDGVPSAELARIESVLAQKVATLPVPPPGLPPPLVVPTIGAAMKVIISLVTVGVIATAVMTQLKPSRVETVETTVTYVADASVVDEENVVDMRQNDTEPNDAGSDIETVSAVRETSRIMNIDEKTSVIARESRVTKQLNLYEQAKTVARAGDYEQALHILDELEAQFPDTALRAEIDLSRVDYLSRAGKIEHAIVAVQKVLAQQSYPQKRPILLRLLGDLWIKRHECQRAEAAYQRAIEAGLDDESAQSAMLGLKQCNAQ